MLQIEFAPLNQMAEQIFQQPKTCRALIERSMPEQCLAAWGKHPFAVVQPDAGFVVAAERTLGPLPATVKACLRGRQPISYHVKNGRLVLRILGNEQGLAEAVGIRFMDVLVASSFGQGHWALSYSELPPPSVRLSDRETEYLIARLDLPIPVAEGILSIEDAEPYIAQAVLAEQLNMAAMQDNPDEALHYLEANRVFVRCSRGEAQYAGDADANIRLVQYTGVRFSANIETDGYVTIGRGVTRGNGMLFAAAELR